MEEDEFVEIKEKILRKISSWSMHLLSMGDKVVFIKAILQAISIYAMQCLMLSITLCCELKSLLCKFWWQNSNSSKGIH